ncbi:hypothetical protein [Rugamonas sp. DEMB1]|jgi:hypothetical protein|uniref:hypothetical protein n=1 Tax=Rugamonas sp. DEMB1 TaxID=3039386 RepID=UPI00244B65D8|nr:hypothetical protein [Rugamonas sp. DEMB1]WGG53140.1 hypothetical protein QC826_14115 [Rugamonas sp. DEMB1]
MRKAEIGFKVDEQVLANAQAFVAKHGGSLDELVSAFLASLCREEKERGPALDPSTSVLMAVSSGRISILEAARQLELPDAGYVFQRLAALGLPLPRLSEEFTRQQLEQARNALDGCLIEPEVTAKIPSEPSKPSELA